MSSKDTSNIKPEIALVLSGGGARAAYQVGVLRGVSSVLPRDICNPFQVISGTSAGAMNEVGLATHPHKMSTGVKMRE